MEANFQNDILEIIKEVSMEDDISHIDFDVEFNTQVELDSMDFFRYCYEN